MKNKPENGQAGGAEAEVTSDEIVIPSWEIPPGALIWVCNARGEMELIEYKPKENRKDDAISDNHFHETDA